MSNQQNITVFNYLTQVQSLFSQYIQIKTQLNLLEKNLDAHGIRSTNSCNKFHK